MRGIVKKWGNSAAVRIPSSVLRAARLGLEQAVEVREESGRIVIEPVRHRPKYTLEELVAQCDPTWSPPVEDREWLDDLPVGNEVI